MGKLAARIARLETLVPTLAWLETWFTILREAAQVAGLDTATAKTLLTALAAHHEALRIPPLVEADQVPVFTEALLDKPRHNSPYVSAELSRLTMPPKTTTYGS